MEAEETPQRRPYSAPEIRRVDLNPEEILIGACKSVSTSASAGSTCFDNSCFDDGS